MWDWKQEKKSIISDHSKNKFYIVKI
jgi:hypothetical protein